MHFQKLNKFKPTGSKHTQLRLKNAQRSLKLCQKLGFMRF